MLFYRATWQVSIHIITNDLRYVWSEVILSQRSSSSSCVVHCSAITSSAFTAVISRCIMLKRSFCSVSSVLSSESEYIGLLMDDTFFRFRCTLFHFLVYANRLLFESAILKCMIENMPVSILTATIWRLKKCIYLLRLPCYWFNVLDYINKPYCMSVCMRESTLLFERESS